MKRYALAHLPNRVGFRFIGITHDGESVECEVKAGPSGMHTVYRMSDGSPFWFRLSAWRPHETKSTQR